MRCSSFTAIYDACVLYPAPLRDLLLWLGLSGCFRARWSARIHEEWKRNLLANRPDLTRAQLDRTSSAMDLAIADSVVTDYASLVEGLTLPDPDDRHVLAAAIRCGAGVIVTFNLKDFPADALRPYGIEAQHPDEFIENIADLDVSVLVNAVRRQRKTLRHPPLTVERLLANFNKVGLVQTARTLAAFRAVL